MATELEQIKTDDMIQLRPIAFEVECTECGETIPSMQPFWTESYQQKIRLCNKCYTAKRKWEAIP